MRQSYTITPSLFFQYATCPHWLWYDLYGDQSKKGSLPELTQKLMEQGVLHEERYIKGLSFSAIDRSLPEADAFKETVKVMKEGASLIYQGQLEQLIGDVLYKGRPDLLEKRPGKSKFGDFYFAPIEIKSSKDIHREHWMQLTLYALLLEQLQGFFPEDVAIINGEKKRIDFKIEPKHREATLERIDEIVRIIKGTKPPTRFTSGCKESPWYSECLHEATSTNDIALIYKVTAKALDSLREYGIRTLVDAAAMDIDALGKIQGASVETVQRAKLQAQCLVENKLHWLEPPHVPDAKVHIYFDIEGDPLLQVEYLFGFWIVGEEGKEPYYKYFIAEQPEDEEKMWREFLGWIEKLPYEEFKVYHYHHYEADKLRSLAKKYGGSPMLDNFAMQLVDISPIVQQSVILPLYFYSIKDIAKSPFINYKWRHVKAGGAQSIFWYEKWLETGDRAVLQDIIDYNEDDVIATEQVHRWLHKKT